jgi:hypothetical protein
MKIDKQSQLIFSLQEFSNILDTDESTLQDFWEKADGDGSSELVYNDYFNHAVELLNDQYKEAIKSKGLDDWIAFDYDCLCYLNQWARIIGSITTSFFESKPGLEKAAMKGVIQKVHEDMKTLLDWHLHCLSFTPNGEEMAE